MSYLQKPSQSREEAQAIRGALAQRALTRAVQTLAGICSGILADGMIHEREIHFLSTWLSDNTEATQTWPGTEIERRVRNILADGKITEAEKQELLETLEQIYGNYFSHTGAAAPDGPSLPLDDDPCIFFKGMNFCFTGRFVYGTRSACERITEKLGANPVSNISQKLNYLVIGTLIEPQWAYTTYGRKIERAVTLRDEGAEIIIVSERQWTAALADNGKF